MSWTQVNACFLWAQIAPNAMVVADFKMGSWKYQLLVDTNDGLGLLIMAQFTDNTLKMLSVDEAKARLIASE